LRADRGECVKIEAGVEVDKDIYREKMGE
jgi:hypothetical protein